MQLQAQVAEVCGGFDFVKLRFHEGKNVAAARNVCASSADTDLIINVDDDIYVEEDAIRKLVDAYHAQPGHCVIAGSVRWGDDWSAPVVMRPIGYGRAARAGETPDFLIGAFFIYSRQLALAKGWNESIRTSDDRFMGALWRASRVSLLFEPAARAVRDHQHNGYGIEHQTSHIYANLFDAIIANPQLLRVLAYEILGFIWGAKAAIKSGEGLRKFFKAWSMVIAIFCVTINI
jgi:glycosyltransferase involved in cell wall biosynthesis